MEYRGGINFVGIDAQKLQSLFVGLLQGHLAVRTDFPDKALSNDQVDGVRDQERLDAHFIESADRTWSIVRVQGRECQMTGVCQFDGKLRRVPVAHFAHHDDVGVVPEY